MNAAIKTILFDEQQISCRLKDMGAQIENDYKEKNLLCIGILNGSAIFMSDLIRKIDMPLKIDFMAASSYGSSTVSSGKVKIIKDSSFDISGYDVLIIEDIIDTGNTLLALKELLLERNPNSLKICAFLDKPSRRTSNITADYTGFTVPDEFIVGYGLDYDNKYRNLPYVGILKPEIYK